MYRTTWAASSSTIQYRGVSGSVTERAHRKVYYADRVELVQEIERRYPQGAFYAEDEAVPPTSASHRSRNENRGGGQLHTPDPETTFERQEREFAEQRECTFDDVIAGNFEFKNGVKP